MSTEHCCSMDDEAIRIFRESCKTFFSSSVFCDFDRDQVVDRVACAISTSSTSTTSVLRRRIAADIVELVWQERLKDPMAVLPMDVGTYMLGFLDLREIIRVRQVGKQWCELGNAQLATVQSITMRTGVENYRQSAVLTVSRRCRSLQSVIFHMCGRTGYTAQDVEIVLSACGLVTSVELACNRASPAECMFAPLRSVVASGRFRSLVLMRIGLVMGDADVDAMVGKLPCLRALHIVLPTDILGRQLAHDNTTSRGLSALINGSPSLNVLYLYTNASLAESFPACRSGIRRLGLTGPSITHDVLQSMLACIGAELRQLTISGCPGMADALVQCIADRCPQLEALSLFGCSLITPACLPFIAQLTNLQDILLDRFDVFTTGDMEWLMQHSRSPGLRNPGECEAKYGGINGYWHACFSFDAMAKAEGVSVTL